MALMNLNIDGVLTVEKVDIPADGITTLSHSLFRGEKIIARHNGDELTRGQDFIPDRIDERLYYQKNVCLFTILKILNESLFGKEIEVEYFACGDYINAEIWNEYPSSASLKQSLASKVDNSDFIKEVKRIDGDINAETTARTDADDTLQDNINTETNLRIAEDGKLQTNINNEATVRADADDTLQDNINAEATSRQTADNEIRNELSSETNLRLAGDAVLQEKIDAEMLTRAENDSNLQSQISDLKTKFESFVPGLTYKVVSALPTADIFNDVIYLVPADSTGSQNVYGEYIYIDGNWELIGTTATTQAITVDSALSETSINPLQNKVITAELKSMGKVYTSLAELGLTADATFQDVVDALPKGGSALLGVTEFTNYQTIFPYEEGNDQFARVYIVKGAADGSLMYARWFRKDGIKEAIAKFSINTNKFDEWTKIITEKSDPYACTSYKALTGTEDLFTLPCGHYVTEKVNTTYHYPVTDSNKVTAHIYVLGYLNEPTNNQGYRIILYFDNKGRTYNVNEWWGVFGSWNRLDLETRVNELFQSVSSGKTLVANAITGKGVSTATDATFATMASNISKINGYKEETKSLIVTSNSTGTEALKFTFSADVIAVKRIVAPSDSCRIVSQTSKDMFTITGKELILYVTGSGRWEVTALVQV